MADIGKLVLNMCELIAQWFEAPLSVKIVLQCVLKTLKFSLSCPYVTFTTNCTCYTGNLSMWLVCIPQCSAMLVSWLLVCPVKTLKKHLDLVLHDYVHLAKMSLCHNLLINQKMWLVTKSIIMIITIIIVYKLLRLYVHMLQHSGSIACNIIEHIWTQGSKLSEWFFMICYKKEENSPSTVPTTRDWSRYYIGILVINTRTVIMESYSTYPQHAPCMSY